VSDIGLAGYAILITFEKAGFHVPDFNNDYAEQVAVGLEAYMSALYPVLAQGHWQEAIELSESASEQAVEVAKSFDVQHWFHSGY